MRHLTAFLLFAALATPLLFTACTNDELPEPVVEGCDQLGMLTYENNVRPIIEQTCAYDGCHLGSAPGNYDSYAGLRSSLESGLFENRVITQAADPNVGMPPNYSPSDRQQDLTEEQMEIIACWLQAGFPE